MDVSDRKMMFKAVVFDVDGTLVDSVEIHAQAWQDAFKEFDHTIDLDMLRGQIGKGGDHLMPVFLSDAEMTDISEALNKRRAEILKSKYLSKIEAFPQVRALFQQILSSGRDIALASSAKGDELQHYKQLASIADLVDVETSADDADHSKPDPDIFQAALSRLHDMSANEVVVIGDTPYDITAAANAGMQSIGFLSGGWSQRELLTAGCLICYRDPAHLFDEFDSSPLGNAISSAKP
jgi:beta-phosphoglucomutase-like phosphatase (HAD superfamily)